MLVAAVLAGAAWYAAERFGQPGRSRGQTNAVLSTDVDGRRHTLPDGSMITLDRDTAVVPQFSKTNRKFALTHGRIFVVTSSAPKQPLSVLLAIGAVTTRDATFDVSLSGPTVTVTVWKGSVEVRTRRARDPGPITVQAGTKRAFGTHGAIVPAAANEPVDRWTGGGE